MRLSPFFSTSAERPLATILTANLYGHPTTKITDSFEIATCTPLYVGHVAVLITTKFTVLPSSVVIADATRKCEEVFTTYLNYITRYFVHSLVNKQSFAPSFTPRAPPRRLPLHYATA